MIYPGQIFLQYVKICIWEAFGLIKVTEENDIFAALHSRCMPEQKICSTERRFICRSDYPKTQL